MTKTKPLTIVLAALAAVLTATVVILVSAHTNNTTAAPIRATKTSVVLHLSGTGNTVTPTFATGPDWSIRYAFACPSGAAFTVIEHGGPGDGVTLADRAGGQGTGTTYAASEPGAHRGQIDTACRWTITVTDGDTLPRATGGAS